MFSGLFIAVPKTGLTSMLEAFKPYHDNVIHTEKSNFGREPCSRNVMYKFEMSTSEWTRGKVGDEIWNNVFKFAFVRNPWDRYVSNWKWLTRKDSSGRGWSHRGWSGIEGSISFKDFVNQIGKIYTMRNSSYQHDKWHVWNQVDHLIDSNGNIMLDYIARFENLNNDFNYVCFRSGLQKLKLPHLNYPGFYENEPLRKYEHYSAHYDDELVEIVRQRCSADIERFGYEYEERKSA